MLALTWWCDASKFKDRDAVICDGAVRSGKTLFLALSFVCWAMRRFEGKQFGMCGKTIVSLRRNVVSLLLPLLRELGFEYSETVSKNAFTVKSGERENTFLLFGGRDESSAALIQGATLAGVLLVLSIRHFMERGFLLNNAYIYATKEQRKTMDKKPIHKVSTDKSTKNLNFLIFRPLFIILLFIKSPLYI